MEKLRMNRIESEDIGGGGASRRQDDCGLSHIYQRLRRTCLPPLSSPNRLLAIAAPSRPQPYRKPHPYNPGLDSNHQLTPKNQ